MTLKGVAAKLEQLPRTIVEEAVKRFDEAAKAAAARALHGSTTMNLHTRKGRRPVKMGTKSNLTGSGAHVTVFINGTPSAQWRWLEDGTKGHQEGKGRTLAAPSYSHPIKGPISHPGSKGQKVWTRAINDFNKDVHEIAATNLRKALHDG